MRRRLCHEEMGPDRQDTEPEEIGEADRQVGAASVQALDLAVYVCVRHAEKRFHTGRVRRARPCDAPIAGLLCSENSKILQKPIHIHKECVYDAKNRHFER